MDTNLESLFDNVLSGTQEAPAGDDGQRKGEAPAEENTQQEAAQEPAEQTKNERAAQAAARREREERERRREQRAYQQARTEMSNLLKELGIEKEDGGTIESVEDLEAVAKARRDDRLSRGNPTRGDIQQIVREEMRSSQRQQTQQTEQKAADNRLVQEQLAQIKAMDPAMTDLKSILESDAGPRFREYVGKGLDFVDAYKLAAEKRLAGIQTNRQGAKGSGKDHLTSTKTAGSGDIDVPQETRDMYKLLMPEMSEAEILKAYNADRKRFGG